VCSDPQTWDDDSVGIDEMRRIFASTEFAEELQQIEF